MGVNYAKLSGARCLITGGSQGLGEALAYEFASHGSSVLLASTNLENLNRVADSCLRKGALTAHSVPVDLRSNAGVKELVEATKSKFGHRLDYLVLNHKHDINPQFWNGSSSQDDLLEATLRTNVLASVQLASGLLPQLEWSQGHIVTISSVAGKIPNPGCAAYSASKHALQGFFHGIRQDLHIQNSPVKVTLCVLGALNTPGLRKEMSGLKNYDKIISFAKPPEGAAVAIVRGVLRGKPELYYPYALTRLLILLSQFPRGLKTLEWINRKYVG